jgi:hypothetical protein
MADITTTRIFTDGEKGITAAKLNDIIGSSTIQPAFVSSKPVASTADPADNMLILKAAGTYAQVPVSTLTTSIGNALPSPDSEIWLVRLRSFNALGNPNFEIDQRNVGTSLSNPATGTFIQDRWNHNKTGTMAVTLGRQAGTITVPGTSFNISQNFLRVTLNTAQGSLGTTDQLQLQQAVEGPFLRELFGDVHSVSLLVRSSVSNLKFSLALRDQAPTKSLVKLCTIPTANVWTLIQLPNLPQMTGGNFTMASGSTGYLLGICLAAGANFIAPAADTFQAGNFFGAPGMSSFVGQAVNSTFDVAFVQHEPGPVCSTLMDKPFTQSLSECQRYFQKSYQYGTALGTVTNAGAAFIVGVGGQQPFCYVPFKVTMGKAPTVVGYSGDTGAANNLRDRIAAVDKGISSTNGAADSGFGGFSVGTPNASATIYSFQYTADTAW